MPERLNEEIKRRKRVVRIFPNAPGRIRLIRALAEETHEDWIEVRRYLDRNLLRAHKKEALMRLGHKQEPAASDELTQAHSQPPVFLRGYTTC